MQGANHHQDSGCYDTSNRITFSDEQERVFKYLSDKITEPAIPSPIPLSCKPVKPANKKWRFDPRMMDHDEFKTPSEKMWFTNNFLEKNRCKSFMHECSGSAQWCPAPNGAGLFEPLPMPHKHRMAAVQSMHKLFADERIHPTSLATLTSGG